MPVEQVHLEQHAAGIVDGRTQAEARDARQRLGFDAVHADDENARQRRPLVRDRQIQRGEAEVATELHAMHDVAADQVIATERGARRIEIARHQRPTHAGRIGDRRHLFDFKAVLLARRLQRREIAGALRAVAEIVANHHPARVQAVHDDPLDKRIRRLAREGMVEMLDHDPVDAVHPQRFELVAQHRDARRRAGRIEEFARVRLEGHHADGQAARIGGCAHVREQSLMAAVDTVEIADGQCAGRTAFGIGKTAEDSHDSGFDGIFGFGEFG